MPLSGGSKFFDPEEYFYPKMLIEINGKPMIQYSIENFLPLGEDLKFIFIIKKNDCHEFHLDYTLRLLTEGKCEFIILDGDTKGSVCSSLLAIDYIDNSHPLIVANFDQFFDCDLISLIRQLQLSSCDAGCLTFTSTHPRWSYALVGQHDNVLETSEKRPISRNAIAGFYYFKYGHDFVRAAQSMIRKYYVCNDVFYTSFVFNELILEDKVVKAIKISDNSYRTFYTPQKIDEFEKTL